MATQTLRPPVCSSVACLISCTLLEAGKLEEWDDALAQIRGRKVQSFVQGDCVLHTETSRGDPTELRQVRAATDLFPQFVHEGTDVRPFGAGDAKEAQRFLVRAEAEAVNVNQLWF